MVAFIDAVHRHFDPLASRYGLRCVSSTPEFVRFVNEKIFLQVRYSASWSYEVGVEIGEIPISANQSEMPPFNLSEVLRLYAVPDATYVERLQASKPEVLTGAIERLAELTEKYAVRLLDGEALDFLRLEQFRETKCAEYALSRDLRYARGNAEKAWATRDFKGIVKALEPVEQHLSQAEKKRLEYSRKQL